MFRSQIMLIGVSIAALLIGVAIGSRFRSAGPEPPPTASTQTAGQIAELTRELDHERGLRGALELELSLLRSEIETSPTTLPEPTTASGATDHGDATSEKTNEAAKSPHGRSARDEWFDTSKLTSLGLDERRTEWLRERFESLQMDELYLRDQATREGWSNQSRFAHELRALREESRAEIGDEDYDSLLFASGRYNRVLLSNVLQNSPAAAAGVQSGDVLLRYGDRAIYDIRDLLAETTSGEPGETTSLDVERNGERLRLYVERGPLGARIQPLRRAPNITP